MSKSRGFCGTDFELDLSFWHDFHANAKLKPDYIIVGEEVCPTTGRKHFQWFFHFKNPRSMEKYRKAVAPRHIEICRGSPQSNIEYCSKDGNVVFEEGDRLKMGDRTDLSLLKKRLISGEPIEDLALECENQQQLRFIEGLSKYVKKKIEYKKKEILWFWGPTGTGKTRTAIEMFEGDCWMSSRNLKWWQGYCGHKNIVIDDFRGDFCTFHELLRILDGYNFEVEVKGSSMPLRAERIVITSCFHPDEVYSGQVDEHMNQLTRRITEIRQFGVPMEQRSAGNTSSADSTQLGLELNMLEL